jgi:hypothetical protein
MTAHDSFNRWSALGIWKRIFDGPVAKSRDPLVTIDSSVAKAHRAASGAKGGKLRKESASAGVAAQ